MKIQHVFPVIYLLAELFGNRYSFGMSFSRNRIIQNILIPLFPQRCVLCTEELSSPQQFFIHDSHAPLCRLCGDRLKTLSGIRCNVCSEPLISENIVCTACRNRTYSFTSNTSVFQYKDNIAELLWVYKFGKQRSLSRVFLHFLLECGLDFEKYTSIVPVPPSPENKQKRGFDQVEIIGRQLARVSGIFFAPVLKRKKGIPQKLLSQYKRQMNLQGLITIKQDNAAGNNPLLLDDIFTTGATANECARVLKEAGAGNVHVLTIAKD